MINYPVRVQPSENSDGKFCVVDRNGEVDVAVCDWEEDAKTIANALNAMDEAPKPSLDTTTWSSWGGWKGKYADWYRKWVRKE